MDLVASNPTQRRIVDPTSSLKEALKMFEDILNDDQRQQYRATITIPNTSTVISLVKTLDENRSKNAQRGVSPRLITFLAAVQQFTGIVDTFVSSNPAIAALVWGGVKTAILAANNVGSFFDKVTRLIMTIGKFCPTYQSFGSLYPGHLDLQNALCEYYAVVVRLCVKIVSVSQRSTLSQTMSSVITPFESEFSDFIAQLEEAADLVKDQCRLALHKATLEAQKLANIERNENDIYRRVGAIFRSDLTKEKHEAQDWRLHQSQREISRLRSIVFDNLSPIKPLKAYKRVLQQKVPKTAEWFQQDAGFIGWRNDKASAVLWCTGTLGVGKTVLMSSMVEHLYVTQGSTDIISHHFCLPDHQMSLEARSVLGSLASQLLCDWIEKSQSDELHVLQRATSDADSDEIVDILSARMSLTKSYFIVLDGIDECEIDEIEMLLKCFARLFQNQPKNLKIVFASRPDVERRLRRSLDVKYRMSLAKSKTQSDIECYVDIILDQYLEEEKLTLTSSSLILKIAETLKTGASGMFLWVRLYIDDLCEQHTDNDILTALNEPPPSVSKLISHKIDTIQKRKSAKDAMKLLQYCGIAKRPLTKWEFRELLSLNVEQRYLDRGKFVHDISQVIADTCGLTYMDEEEETLHYIHHSIRNHLFSISGINVEEFSKSCLDLQLGFLCLTYLEFNDFRREMVKMKQGSNMAVRPVDLGVASISSSSKTATRLARILLRRQSQLVQMRGKDLERKIQDIAGVTDSAESKLELQYYFLSYAKTYWLEHLWAIEPGSDRNMWRLFRRCAEGKNELVDTPWRLASVAQPGKEGPCAQNNQVMAWALVHRKPALLMCELIFGTGSLSESLQKQILETAEAETLYNLMNVVAKHKSCSRAVLHSGLVNGAARGLNDCVDLYICYCREGNLGADRNHLQAALQAAAGGGHLEVVERLIAAKAEVNAAAAEYGGRTALQAAAGGGHLKVVERLIAAKAEVNAAAAENNGRTALQAAAGGGHLEVVERLIAAKAEVNTAAAEYSGRTALQAAAGGGHFEVVERLIAAKAEVNATAAAGNNGRTALQAAAEGGHLEVVERLIAAKAEANAAAAENDGRTALQAAAEGGHIKVVERLIAAKAEVNAAAAEYGGRTALQAAAGGGHLEVVERLIAAKAEVNAAAAENNDRTALQAAAGGGHLEVVERLIAAKADVNAAAEYNGRTALQAAAEGGHLEVVERLIAAKAEANAAAAENDGRTALQAAAEGGHIKVVERLIAAKAEVNAAAAEYGGRTALQAAAGGGHLEVVERFIAAKAEVNAAAAKGDGRTALQAAAGGGHLEVVERLIAAKADVNAAAEHDGRTALQAAAGEGHLEVVKRLIAAKAEVNAAAAKGDGRTALQAAVGGGHLEVVERFIVVKVDVNVAVVGYNGRTALQAAAGGGHLEMVERFIAAKAEVNAAAAEYGGQTALQAAAGGGHLEVVERLIAAKAEINAAAAEYGGRTALQAAAEGGFLEVVAMLKSAGAIN